MVNAPAGAPAAAPAGADRPSPACLSAAQIGEARLLASAVSSWYLNTIDPFSPHAQNVESRLRHPVHVVTRRLLYGNIHAAQKSDVEAHASDLESLFNDDDAEIKEGPEQLTRRTEARMEAFLASIAVALREDEVEAGEEHMDDNGAAPKARKKEGGKGGKDKKKVKKQQLGESPPAKAVRARSGSSAHRIYRQIDRGELLYRLELYCRALRRMRAMMDADPSKPMEECVIRYESKKGIRSYVRIIVQNYLRNVDCVRDVQKTLMNLVLRATLILLSVEVWCPELRETVHRLASEYEHKVSFASLAFLSSPDNSAETHLAPLLTHYFEYLQMNWESLVSKCELERMLRTVLDADLRHFFKNAVFHSVGHILDECRRERESLDNIALPPPWVGGGDAKDADEAMARYCSDPAVVKQALRDLRREVITVNGQMLPPSHSHTELAEHLGEILNSNQLVSPRKSMTMSRRRSTKKRMSNYASDFGFGLELESDFSGTESDASLASKVDVGLVDRLARRLLISASRTGTGGDAYFIVRDLFGGEEVEVVPHHSSGKANVNQGTIEIIVKMSSVIIKQHAKYDIFSKPIVNDSDALIQFHTTTTETIQLQQSREGPLTLKEKKTSMTGWRTLAIRPAYYERIPQMH
ncbi:hypothetical protein ACHAXT_006828 [Thalassiosira profunda]